MRFSGKAPCGFEENLYLCPRKRERQCVSLTTTKSKVKMRKTGILTVCGLMLLSSCSSYTATGAYTGAQFGTILGSAIGGISGGWRGSDIGSIVGMAGGAAVGAAIGSAVENAQKEKIEKYHKQIEQREYGYQQQGDDSGFDATNSGDDRINIDMEGPKGDRTFNPATNSGDGDNTARSGRVEIRRAIFTDTDRDGILRAGEECKVSFEIMNRTRHTLYDVQPMVYDVSGNKHIHISPNLHVESIAPNSGVRYTATILADRKLKDGTAKIRVGATVGNKELSAQEKEFTIVTRRK